MKKKTVKKKAPKRKNYPTKLQVINLKATKKVEKLLLAKAKRFTDNNLSQWLRNAGLKYVPKKGEKLLP